MPIDIDTEQRFDYGLPPQLEAGVINLLNAKLSLIGGTGDALVANPLSQFAPTTSAQLAGVITDETGVGALVFASAPTLLNPVVGTQSPGDSTTLAASTAFVAAAISASGSGTVSGFSFVNANGISGSVANAATTPALTLSLDNSGVTPGTYTSATLTVNEDGIVTFAASGGGLPAVPVDFKDSVDVATTGPITLSGEQTIDGVLTASSRVLVKNQAAAAANGIYLSAAGAWARTTDADISVEVTSGTMVFVEQGTASGGLVFLLVTPDPITLGTTALSFVAIQLPFSFFVGKTVSTTTYTHILTDSGKRLNCTNAGTKTITIAPQSSVNSAVNTEIEIHNTGAGLLTVAPGSGVTISSLSGVLTVPQYHCVKLKKRANPNTWDMTGIGLSAAAAALLASPTQPFDVHVFYPGIPTASVKVTRVPIARAITFAANFAGSYFAASANATASTVFDVQKNGSSIGTVTIGAGGTTATFATSGGSAQTFAAGDLLAIIAPATPDATLADPGFVLAGTR